MDKKLKKNHNKNKKFGNKILKYFEKLKNNFN